MIRIYGMLLFILLSSPQTIYGLDHDAETKSTLAHGDAASTFIITRLIDGDTLELSNNERVRLIGIDTPESSNNPKARRDSERTRQDIQIIIAMGSEATEFVRQLLLDKRVRLEFDVQERDKYGRQLAYVFLEDGTFLNAEILKAGYAQVMTIPPNVKYQDLFLKLQQEAREAKRGFWK